MNERRCKNCIWWDNQHTRITKCPEIPGIVTPGICRKHKPGAERVEPNYYLGVQPIMDAEDFCAEYRDS